MQLAFACADAVQVPLQCVALDSGEHALFAGGSDGSIFEVDLLSVSTPAARASQALGLGLNWSLNLASSWSLDERFLQASYRLAQDVGVCWVWGLGVATLQAGCSKTVLLELLGMREGWLTTGIDSRRSKGPELSLLDKSVVKGFPLQPGYKASTEQKVGRFPSAVWAGRATFGLANISALRAAPSPTSPQQGKIAMVSQAAAAYGRFDSGVFKRNSQINPCPVSLPGGEVSAAGGGHLTLQPIARMAGHERPVNSLAFSSDGEVLVSGAYGVRATILIPLHGHFHTSEGIKQVEVSYVLEEVVVEECVPGGLDRGVHALEVAEEEEEEEEEEAQEAFWQLISS
eukprot:1159869-Pelagomonas_calceolata.AAC.3